MSGALWSLGRTRDSQAALAETVEDMQLAGKGGASFFLQRIRSLVNYGESYVEMGDTDRAGQIRKDMELIVAEFVASQPPDSIQVHFATPQPLYLGASIARRRGEWRESFRLAEQGIQEVRDLPPGEGVQRNWKFGFISWGSAIAAEAQLALGDFKSAERSAREGYAARKSRPESPVTDGVTLAAHSRNLALALLGQQRDAEAREAIAPAVTFMREVQKRNRQDEQLRFEIAKTLFVEALTDPPRRAALLHEATAMMDALPESMRSLGEVKRWRERVRAAS
jgi:hypothetical protein